MADVNDLGLPPDEAIEIDYNAPEPGSFPPSLYPGTYTFLFKLEDDPLDTVEIEGRKYLQVRHIAKTEVQEPSPNDPSTMVTRDVELRFQRVNAYKHPKMANSSLGDLIRSLDLRFSGPMTTQNIVAELRGIEERKSYQAEVGWRTYCKSCEKEVATHPRKKKVKEGSQVAWPKGADGRFTDMAECPGCHSKMFGNAEVVRYKLPTAEASFSSGR